MQIFNEIINNKCIVVPIIVWFLIQTFKTVTDLCINKKINVKRIMGAGGMPSSHSAVVTSLAVLIGKENGFDSGLFALSVVFAFVVMYDAAGVRRAAGKQAAVLNKILATPGMTSVEVQEKLVEFLGHTPVQVFVGAAIGILVGVWV